MSETFWVEHHADYAGRANGATDSATKNGWSSRRKLCCFLGFGALAWGLFLAPFLFLG